MNHYFFDATRKQITQGHFHLLHVHSAAYIVLHRFPMSNFVPHHPPLAPLELTTRARHATLARTLRCLRIRAWQTSVQDPSKASPYVRPEQWTRSVAPSGSDTKPHTCIQPTLFKMAFELGAISTSDFTDRVTHLIATSHGGAKYLVCSLAPPPFVLTHVPSVPLSARYLS